MFTLVHLLYGLAILAGVSGIVGVRWILHERREDIQAATIYPDDIDYDDEDDYDEDDEDDEDEDGEDYDEDMHLTDMTWFFAHEAGTRHYHLTLPAWQYGYIADREAASYHDGQEAARRRFRKSCGLAA